MCMQKRRRETAGGVGWRNGEYMHTHSECSKLTAALGCDHGAVCVLCGCCASSADEFDVREYVVG